MPTAKCLLLLTASLLIAIIFVSTVQTSPQTIVQIEPYRSFAEVGQNFTINVTVKEVQNLYGLEVILYWNQSILKAIDVDVRLGVESYGDGVLHEILGTANVQIYENKTIQELGKYVLAASSIAPAPSFNGSGNIARITFNVTNAGTCELNLQTKLYDKPPVGHVSEPIPHTTYSGFFGGEPSETSWWLYVIVTIAILAVIVVAALYYKKAIVSKKAYSQQ